MKKLLILSTITSIVLFTLGCGGSGGSPDTAASQNDEKAQFLDSAVKGLSYSTQSTSGVTDENGYFKYKSTDKSVVFKIGEMKIGEINIADIKNKVVLPSDLLGLERTNTTDENLVKIIQFLQSLDRDQNPNNGIEIDEPTVQDIIAELEANHSIKRTLTENNITVLQNLITAINKKWVAKRTARKSYKKQLTALGYEPEFIPFIMIWEVSGSDKNITIPVNMPFISSYKYTIDWGDGTVSKDMIATVIHTYQSDGNYTVKITGSFPAIYLNGDTNAKKLKKITQWGDVEWMSFENAFAGAQNLEITAADTPDLEKVTNMSYAFQSVQTNTFNNIENWDVSNVTNMSGMFLEASAFNQPLNNWNVANVTDMSYMFWHAAAFNQPIEKWNVGNVKNMTYMFAETSAFNQPLNSWNVGNVQDMSFMFYKAAAFNQPLDNWDVSNVSNMTYMFYKALSFDQNISMWNVSNVTQYTGFATGTPIENNTSKLPQFP